MITLLGAVPYPCNYNIVEDIMGWVEVAKEEATRAIRLAFYPTCTTAANAYRDAVTVASRSEEGYRHGHAKTASKLLQVRWYQENNMCPNYLTPENSDLFHGNNNTRKIKALYKGITGNTPSSKMKYRMD